jgi:hypothetical protein
MGSGYLPAEHALLKVPLHLQSQGQCKPQGEESKLLHFEKQPHSTPQGAQLTATWEEPKTSLQATFLRSLLHCLPPQHSAPHGGGAAQPHTHSLLTDVSQ